MNFTTIQLSPSQDYEKIKRYWLELAQACQHNYFQSWGWIHNWLKSLPEENSVYCNITLKENDAGTKPVIGFFVGYKNYLRFKCLPVKAAYLNEVGNTVYDQLTIEDNDILSTEETSHQILDLLQQGSLAQRSEFHFHWASENLRNKLTPLYPKRLVQESVWPNYYVDLEEIRKKGCDYLSLLSSNKRQQIRRSIKEYKKFGELNLEKAGNPDSALVMLNELSNFHQAAWTNRQHPGAFSNQYFMEFHRQLIVNRFSSGEILMVKISVGANPIGYIYGFIYGEEFLYYQSGFKYESSNKLRPGLVSHYLLIEDLLPKTVQRYDFMAGEDNYKKSLSTHNKPMYIIRLRHKQIRYYLIHFFIACWQVMKKIREKE